MKLIADTNRIFAALVKDSFSRKILFCDKIQIYTIEFSKRELEKYFEEIMQKAKVSENEL